MVWADRLDAPLEAVLRAELSTLLDDHDVSAVRALFGAPLEVMRRGRRERLEAALATALFEQLGEALARRTPDEGLLCAPLDRHRVTLGRLPDGRPLLFVQKAPSLDVSLEDLEDECLLPAGLGAELLAVAAEGHGLVALGPAPVGADRLVAAIARALAERLGVALASEGDASWASPLPAGGGGVVARFTLAAACGADAALAFALSLDEAAALAGAATGALRLVSVRCPSAAHLEAALAARAAPVAGLAGQLCVLGYDAQGRPRLVEYHAPQAATPREGAPREPPREPAREPAREPPPARPDLLSSAAALPPSSSVGDGALSPVPGLRVPLDGLPPLGPLPAGPPVAWASTSPEDDPGWELSGPPPPGAGLGAASEPPAADGGPFARVMAEVRGRPTFTPRPPAPHPQARQLQDDPFGGLTFEPPGSAAAEPVQDDEDDLEPPARRPG